MTESQWNTSTSPGPMLDFLLAKNYVRKRRLFAVACCRRIERLMPQESRTAIAVAERFADGAASEIERKATWLAVGKVLERSPSETASCAFRVVEANNQFHRVTSRTRDAAGWIAEAVGRLDGNEGLADLVRCIFGAIAFRPVHLSPLLLTASVSKLAHAIYGERRFGDVPILGDALEQAGCDNADILSHCRSEGPHTRGCWVVDLVLAKP